MLQLKDQSATELGPVLREGTRQLVRSTCRGTLGKGALGRKGVSAERNQSPVRGARKQPCIKVSSRMA